MALLKEAYPELYAQMVHPDPTITHGTDKKILWRCEEGHTWKSRPRHRLRKERPGGCPECYRNSSGVYLIAQKYWANGEIEAVKIGMVSKVGNKTFEDSVRRRLTRLQIGNAQELFILKTFPGLTYKQEQKIHEQLDDIRANGEWFYIGGDQKTLDRVLNACLNPPT